MTAPLGAVVRIHVDLLETVGVGDIIQTGTGRRYSVLGVRIQQRGKHAGRQHLQCLVVANDWLPETPEPDAKLHTIRWYKRGKS